MNDKAELSTTDVEKDDVLNKLFASLFTGCWTSHAFHVPEHLSRVGEEKSSPPKSRVSPKQAHEAERIPVCGE